MSRRQKRLIIGGLALVGIGVSVPALLWYSLKYEPTFYRQMATVPRAQSQERARRFVAQSAQLRNDIYNEPRWEAVFSDEEVNAWLAEDLVTHFADQLPPEVHDPRILFEPDRVTFAFKLDQGRLQAVISVVARVRVPEQNMVELTLEKIRAGAVPVPAQQIIDRITDQARSRGLDIRWKPKSDVPIALIKYTPDLHRSDVVLEQLHIRSGQIRLAGRSNRVQGGVISPVLPRHKVLQSAFPRRNVQRQVSPPPSPARGPMRSSSSPTS